MMTNVLFDDDELYYSSLDKCDFSDEYYFMWSDRFNKLNWFSQYGKCPTCKKQLIHDKDLFKLHDDCYKPRENICAICQDNVYIHPLSCGHVFHISCITAGYIEKCPTCRVEIREDLILQAQPSKPIPEEIPPIIEQMTLNDVSNSLLNILYEGILVTDNLFLTIRNGIYANDLMLLIKMALMQIRGVDLYHMRDTPINDEIRQILAIRNTSINSTNEINNLILFLSYIYNKLNSERRRELIQSVGNLISNYFGYLREDNLFNVPTDNFDISINNGILELINGNIKFENYNYGMPIFIQLNLLRPYRYNILKMNSFQMANAEKCSAQESFQYIGIAIGFDIECVYMQPYTDNYVANELSLLLTCVLKHIIKIYTLESIRNLLLTSIEQQQEKLYLLTNIIFTGAFKLLSGEPIYVKNAALSIIETFKN